MRTVATIVLSLIGGAIGALLVAHIPTPTFGATVARTTITNPWTFASTTIFSAKVTVTSTNAATSTLNVGCIGMNATSTASPGKITLVSNLGTASTTGANGLYFVPVWTFGTCP